MLSRVNFLETDPDRVDDVGLVVRDVVHPAISAEPGYLGYVVLGDRETGRALGVTLWASEDARAASDLKAREIRPIVESRTGGTMRAVEQYEVLFADLRAAADAAE